MATSATNRDDRIELRTTKEEKRLLATAAAYERLDVTSFIMRNVLRPPARWSTALSVSFCPSAIRSASCFSWRIRRSPLQPCSPPPVAVVPGTVDPLGWREEPISRSHDRKEFRLRFAGAQRLS